MFGDNYPIPSERPMKPGIRHMCRYAFCCEGLCDYESLDECRVFITAEASRHRNTPERERELRKMRKERNESINESMCD